MPPRFPVLDPEPSPPGRLHLVLRAVLAIAAVLVVLAGVGAAGTVLTRPSMPAGATPPPTRSASAASIPGGIVYVDQDSYRVTGEPGALASSLSQTDKFVAPAVNPSGKSLLTFSGLLISTTGGRGEQLPSDPGAPVQAVGHPWAGDGKFLVLQGEPPGGQLPDPTADYPVSMLALETGALTPLAPAAASAAGDPTSAAAFATIPGREIRQGGNPGRATAALVRLVPGAPPARLADDASLARAADLPDGTDVVVGDLAPSPDGALLALTVSPATAAEPDVQETLVVLRRDGSPVARAPTTAVDAGYGELTWSPDGDLAALVYGRDPTGFTTSEHLMVWRLPLGTPPRDVALPGHLAELPAGQGPSLGPPVWAPDGGRLLVGDDRAWWLVSFDATPVERLEPVPGRPLAWLSSKRGSPG